MTYLHYTKISRENGVIERIGGKLALGKRGIHGIANATTEARVVSTEPDQIMGWGDATAIGRIQLLIDGIPEGVPVLALLA